MSHEQAGDDFFGDDPVEAYRAKLRNLLDRGSYELDLRTDEAFQRFVNMRSLTEKQRAWVDREHARLEQYRRDVALLQAVAADGDAATNEADAFRDMLARRRTLTDAQRLWLRDVAQRLGLLGAENLHSRGLVPDGPVGPGGSTKLPWELEGYVKPTKPPGRM